MIKGGEDNMRQNGQTIEFTGQEEQTFEVVSGNVTILPSIGGHRDGSSKVKLKSIIDFTWEHRYYVGQLMAVHMSSKFLAYGIKGNGKGMVRVLSKDTDQRILIKGMRGIIQDLAFAHVANPTLAFVDYTGSLYVYSIEILNGQLLYNHILQVDADDTSPMSHRVIWCPYIPEEEASDADEVSKLLVLTRGSKAELWSIAAASRLFNTKVVKATDPQIKESSIMLEIYQHSGTIVEATFSPDGTALATASSDGEIKFFQVYLHGASSGQQPPKCLHQWRPHDGRPISSLFFLDDHKNYNPEAQFWRFAVTGCDNNSEIKIWSCELWNCLQTIKFAPHPVTGKMPVLKAGLDLAAGYLLLSDIYNKVLYIFSIVKDSEDAMACINTVSEFLLPSPFLSFSIVDAGQRRLRFTNESLEDLCPADDDNEDQLVVRMYLVQPKSLQECHIAFRPPLPLNSNCLMDTLTHDSLDYSEDLPDLNTITHNGIIVNDDDEGENVEDDANITEAADLTNSHNAGLNLMTPDAFSSPAKKESVLDSKSSSPQLGNIESASPSIAQTVQALNTADQPLATSKLEEQAPPSGGSSPSREVREILSLAEPEENETEIKSEPTNANENWSQIPLDLMKDAIRAMQEQVEVDLADLESQLDIKKDPSPVQIPPKAVSEETHNTWTPALLAMTNKLDAVLEIVQEQQQEIGELRIELMRIREEAPLFDRLEAALALTIRKQLYNVEQTIHAQATRQQDFLKNVEVVVKEKIEDTIPRVVQDIVEPLKRQLKVDASQIDSIVKENLTKLLGGVQVREAVATAVSNAAKPTLEHAFKEAFTGILLPGMEKACQNMFKQVQDAFLTGTREYLQNVDSIMDKQYQKQNKQQSETLATAVREEVKSEFSRGLSMIQENTIRSVRDSLRENFTQHMSDISGIRSRATTPGLTGPTTADVQARVMSLLQRGQINAAFQQALSASDLNLVVFACDNTDPSRVFYGLGPGPRSVLMQPVLLSLVQQLSANLNHRTELKHRWLEEAVLSLDPNDPVTREHMANVLPCLQSQVATFITAHPTHASVRGLKMVSMAAQALMKP